jgi:hypothetical protein
MAVHRRRHGRGGIQTPQWLAHHFRGELYQLGRLQFERGRLGARTARTIAAASGRDMAAGQDVTGGEGVARGQVVTDGQDVAAGAPCLNLHIPDFHGPLTPAACDQSVAWAREFFARHFPEEPYETGVCYSWLLDPQLKRYLPADSNIVRFQERFRTAGEDPEPADREPVQFVFGDPDLPLEDLPRRTSVERAIGDHLRAGGHWYIGAGWFPLGFLQGKEETGIGVDERNGRSGMVAADAGDCSKE